MDSKQVNKIIKKCAFIIFGAIILTCFLFNFQSVKSILDFIMKILTPFLIGIVFALFLNIPMGFFQKQFRKLNKSGETKDYNGISLVLSIICIILVILFVALLIVPELINVGKIFSENIPLYQQKIGEFVTDISNKLPNVDVNAVVNFVTSSIENIKDQFINFLPTIFSSSFEIIIGTINGIVNFFIGLGFTFLCLGEKNRIKSESKKFLYAYKSKEKADRIVKVLNNFVSNFNNFVIAQCINALSIGIVCILGLLILQVPYAVQVGVLVGFMSLIPILGTPIGIVIGLILIIFVDPIKALIFLIFTIIIWQVFENVVKPRIVGKKTGISNFLLFVATIAGGTAFGALGILFAVPVTNTGYIMITERIEAKNKAKDKTKNIKDKKDEKERIDTKDVKNKNKNKQLKKEREKKK